MPRCLPLPVVVLAAVLAACRGTTYYVHPRADLGAIEKVAALPFDAVAQDRAGADKVGKIFLMELLATNAFEVVEPGLVLKVLRDEKVEQPAQMTPADVQRVGKALGAQGLFFGSVIDFDESRAGTVATPEITIQLRLVETQSGTTVWSASRTRSGATIPARLFGIGGDSLTEAARGLIREELDTLLR